MKGQPITEKVFNLVKLLSKEGLKTGKIANVVGIATHTISRIKNASSYSEYKQLKLRERESHLQKVATAVADYPADVLSREEKDTNDLLRDILAELKKRSR